MTDDLRDFARAATGAWAFDEQAPRALEPEQADIDETADAELEGDDDDEADQEAGQVDEATAAAFWASLTQAQIERAETDPDYHDAVWQEWWAANGDDSGDAEADSDDEEDDAGQGWASAGEMVQAVLAGEIDPVDENGDPMSPAAWLSWAANAPENQWIAAARSVGHDPRIRPSHGDIRQFGLGAQGAVLAEDWEATKERLRAKGEYL